MNRKLRRIEERRRATARPLSGPLDRAALDAMLASAQHCHEAGDMAGATALCKAILKERPAHAPALNLLGVIAQQAGRNANAVRLIGEALAAEPYNAVCHYNLALALQALGRHAQASDHLDRAVSCHLREAVPLLLESTAINAALQRMAAAWPRRLSLDELFAGQGGKAGGKAGGEAGLEAALEDNPLLESVLRYGLPHDVSLERFLTDVRLAFLRHVQDGAGATVSERALKFFCALALQCFGNGYAYDVTGDEMRAVDALQQALCAGLERRAEVPAAWIVAIAAYRALHVLPCADALLARDWPPALAPLLTQQIREPRAEAEIRKSIRSLTEIDDETSRKVQRQYEENPYPCWSAARPALPVTLRAHLASHLPSADVSGIAENVADVLVAGCGTGRHAIDVAQRFPSARVLAIDISRTSLAYAIRKSGEAGIKNVEYAHADILKLDSLGRRFDVIESVGVLHHLEEPARGLRVLVSLLKPGGVMMLGLYSESARRAIVAARAMIAQRGFGTQVEEIRRARQEVIRWESGGADRDVTYFTDFFSIGGCRDLLFNVMEHRFTIPLIAGLIAENGLRFLGFAVEPAVRERFAARFPEPRASHDLDCWHRFETENPTVFGSMYEFYLHKPETSA